MKQPARLVFEGLVAASSLAGVLLLTTPARGDVTKPQCIDANTQAQSLRRDGKLSAARAQLRTCSDASCPDMVRSDCIQRLDELEHAQPTILFDAKDGDGHDLAAVRVSVDGQPFAEKLEGKALPIDPGFHAFTFTSPGLPAETRTFVVKEGEKERRERIVLGATSTLPQPSAPGQPVVPPPAGLPATPPDAASSNGPGTQRILGLAAGGAGVVGLGVGTVFGILASSAWSNAKSACGGDTGHCANVASATSYRSTTETDGTVSTVAFIAGGVLLAGGAVLFLTGRHGEPAPTASVAVAPVVGPSRGGLSVIGCF